MPNSLITLDQAAKLNQGITSEHTCINHIPALHKRINWQSGLRNLDYGGGKYNTATDYLTDLGVTNLVYDPFNRTPEWNRVLLGDLFLKPADTATIANVLNVVKEPQIRKNILRHVKTLVRKFSAVDQLGMIFISCYEGDGSGVGAITSKGWQENRKEMDYLSEIREVFPRISIYGGKFIAAYNV